MQVLRPPHGPRRSHLRGDATHRRPPARDIQKEGTGMYGETKIDLKPCSLLLAVWAVVAVFCTFTWTLWDFPDWNLIRNSGGKVFLVVTFHILGWGFAIAGVTKCMGWGR
jgi:hypothetical protein